MSREGCSFGAVAHFMLVETRGLLIAWLLLYDLIVSTTESLVDLGHESEQYAECEDQIARATVWGTLLYQCEIKQDLHAGIWLHKGVMSPASAIINILTTVVLMGSWIMLGIHFMMTCGWKQAFNATYISHVVRVKSSIAMKILVWGMILLLFGLVGYGLYCMQQSSSSLSRILWIGFIGPFTAFELHDLLNDDDNILDITSQEFATLELTLPIKMLLHSKCSSILRTLTTALITHDIRTLNKLVIGGHEMMQRIPIHDHTTIDAVNGMSSVVNDGKANNYVPLPNERSSLVGSASASASASA